MAPPLRGARSLLLATFALVSLGCQPTEVVIVTDSDAIPGQDFLSVQFQLTQGNQAFADASQLPATWGLTPSGSATEFDVTIMLTRERPFESTGMTPFATRKASHVRFVDGEMKVLFLPVFKSCAFVGTNGPNPLPPECREVTSPALGDFDEDNIPRLAKK